MAGTDVITGKMLDVSNSVEDIVQRYITSVEKLYTIGGEIDAMWKGDASRKFMSTLGNDRERFNALTKMLNSYIEVLRNDVDIYVKAENDAISILSTNKIR